MYYSNDKDVFCSSIFCCPVCTSWITCSICRRTELQYWTEEDAQCVLHGVELESPSMRTDRPVITLLSLNLPRTYPEIGMVFFLLSFTFVLSFVNDERSCWSFLGFTTKNRRTITNCYVLFFFTMFQNTCSFIGLYILTLHFFLLQSLLLSNILLSTDTSAPLDLNLLCVKELVTFFFLFFSSSSEPLASENKNLHH